MEEPRDPSTAFDRSIPSALETRRLSISMTRLLYKNIKSKISKITLRKPIKAEYGLFLIPHHLACDVNTDLTNLAIWYLYLLSQRKIKSALTFLQCYTAMGPGFPKELQPNLRQKIP